MKYNKLFISMFFLLGLGVVTNAAPKSSKKDKIVNNKTATKKPENFVTYKKSVDYNNYDSWRISVNNHCYVYYDDVYFKLMFYNKNYSEILNVEEFCTDTEIACNKAIEKYHELKYKNYDWNYIQQTTLTNGTYANILDKPLYQFNYVIENNVHFIQLLVRENEWSDYHYVYSLEIGEYASKLIKVFTISYMTYLTMAKSKMNVIKRSNTMIKDSFNGFK